MGDIVNIFDKLELENLTYSPTHGEITALQTISTYIGNKIFCINEIQTVSDLLSKIYSENELLMLDNLIDKGLKNSWDLSIGSPDITESAFDIEYTLNVTDTYKYILDKHELIIPELPRLFHSLYINQFLDQFNNQQYNQSILFPDKKETKKYAINSENNSLLELFSIGNIKGFSKDKIIGTSKNLEFIL